MQTWVVHMRSPLRLAPPGFAVFQLLAGGTVLAALIHSLFAARLVWTLALTPMDDVMTQVLVGFDGITLVAGYLISALLGLIGLARRRLLGCAWVLLLIPLYWLLLSLAAWRALFQLEDRTRARPHLPPRCRSSEIALQIRRRFFRTPLHVEWRNEAALLVHQINDRGVIHGIAAAVGRHLLGIDAIGPLRSNDRGFVAGDADDAWIKTRQIVFEFLRRVALWIDGDKQRANILGVGAKRAENLRDLEQRGRTDVRTVGEAEEHQERMALQILVGNRFGILIDQLEWSADRRR